MAAHVCFRALAVIACLNSKDNVYLHHMRVLGIIPSVPQTTHKNTQRDWKQASTIYKPAFSSKWKRLTYPQSLKPVPQAIVVMLSFWKPARPTWSHLPLSLVQFLCGIIPHSDLDALICKLIFLSATLFLPWLWKWAVSPNWQLPHIPLAKVWAYKESVRPSVKAAGALSLCQLNNITTIKRK